MVYDRAPYETELTNIPLEMGQVNEILNYCFSKCRHHYGVAPHLIHFKRLTKIPNEIPFD